MSDTEFIEYKRLILHFYHFFPAKYENPELYLKLIQEGPVLYDVIDNLLKKGRQFCDQTCKCIEWKKSKCVEFQEDNWNINKDKLQEDICLYCEKKT